MFFMAVRGGAPFRWRQQFGLRATSGARLPSYLRLSENLTLVVVFQRGRAILSSSSLTLRRMYDGLFTSMPGRKSMNIFLKIPSATCGTFEHLSIHRLGATNKGSGVRGQQSGQYEPTVEPGAPEGATIAGGAGPINWHLI